MRTAYGIVVAVLVVALWYSIFLNTHNKATISSEQRRIDSFAIEFIKLDSQHVKKDSTITVYKDSIVYVDKIIETEKIKYIHIKQKYDEIRNRINHYTPTQLDSFFAKRYGYIKTDSISQSR